jgi:hypothetical protein
MFRRTALLTKAGTSCLCARNTTCRRANLWTLWRAPSSYPPTSARPVADAVVVKVLPLDLGGADDEQERNTDTMVKSKETVKQEIKEHIKSRGDAYSDWYVGIAADANQRLFNDHNVDKQNGCWIYRECQSSTAAREVEEYFINILGTDGGTGGGDQSAKSVYAYKKTSYTKE